VEVKEMAPNTVITYAKRLRGLLDVLAACGMLIASGVILSHYYSDGIEPPAVVPATPIDLADAHRRGDDGAPVVLLEFAEFLCPYCQRFAQMTLPAILEGYVDTGKVLFAYRHLPLEGLHPFAALAGAAAECAATRGQFWRVHDLFFEGPGELDLPVVLRHAASLGFDHDWFESCLHSAGAERVKADQAAAEELGIRSTPYFLIGRRDADGRLRATHVLRGAQPFAAFAAVLDEVLADD
jgi:protein-disulfide isomerase